MKSRILAILMALLIVVAFMPALAYADGKTPTGLDLCTDDEVTTAPGASAALIGIKAVGGGITANPEDPEDTKYTKVICESKNPEIATVEPQLDKDGNHKRMRKVQNGPNEWWKWDVIGHQAGTTKITITAAYNENIKKTVTVNVVEDLLTVKANGETKKIFKAADFADENLTTIANWDGRKHTFTTEKGTKAKGLTLETVLTESGISVNRLADDQLIRFTSADKIYKATFTVRQILRDKRYYYPNDEDLDAGAVATDEQMADAVEIPTLLCNLDNSDGRLVFGQTFPNERNLTFSLKNMTSGGTIEILNATADQLSCNVTANIPSGGIAEPGTQIKLNSKSLFDTEIYYTLDGNIPSMADALYNYRTKELDNDPDGGLKNAVIKAPADENTFTIKVRQMAYGKAPSKTKTFTYRIAKIKKYSTYTLFGQNYKVITLATAKAKGVVTFIKSKNAKSITVPATIDLSGKKYNVTRVGEKAFTGSKIRTVTVGANVSKLNAYALKGSKATKLIIKTKKFTKSAVKNSLKGSKIKYVVVKVGTKKVNKTYITKYKKFFTKANAGKAVTVK